MNSINEFFDDDRPIFRPFHDDDDNYPGPCRCSEDNVMRKKKSTEIKMCDMTDIGRDIYILSEKGDALLNELGRWFSNDDNNLNGIVVRGDDQIDSSGETIMAVLGKIRTLFRYIRRDITGDKPVQTFDIWREGFADEDEGESAILLAKGIPGNDFSDAVDYWYRSTENARQIYGPLSFKGKGSWRKIWLWGCRLYDNEADARKRFG